MAQTAWQMCTLFLAISLGYTYSNPTLLKESTSNGFNRSVKMINDTEADATQMTYSNINETTMYGNSNYRK